MENKNFYEFVVAHEINSHLKSEWINLEKENICTIFQSYNWVEYWNNIYINNSESQNLKPFIVKIYYEKKLVSIIPLVVKNTKFNFKILKFLGEPYNDFNFPILKKNFEFDLDFYNIFKSFLKKYKNQIDFIFLEKLLPYFQSTKNPLLFENQALRSNINFYIHSENWLKYCNMLNLSNNSEIDRKFKNLNKAGKLDFIFDAKENLEIITKFIIENKNKQFLNRKKKNIFFYKKNVEFIRYLFEKNFSNYSILKLDNKIISAHVGYIHKDTFYHIMPTHDINYNKFSPGNVLLKKMIEVSLDLKDINFFNFTIGPEVYKKKWSNKSNYLYTLFISHNLKGFICCIFHKLKTILSYKYILKL